MRNQMRADLVMLIGYYPNAGACGLAWVNDNAASANPADYGYSVVNVDVSGSSYCDLTVSGVHEVGHNFGMRHDRPNGGNSRLDYNFGYVNLPYRSRTIMAYNNQCTARGFSCPVVFLHQMSRSQREMSWVLSMRTTWRRSAGQPARSSEIASSLGPVVILLFEWDSSLNRSRE